MAEFIKATMDTRTMARAFVVLNRSVQNRAIRFATDAGAGVLKRAFQAAAPVRSGATKRSMRIRKVKVRGGQKRVIGPSYKKFPIRRTKKGRVRVATKKTAHKAFATHIPGNVAHLTEFGHRGPRPAAAHPWMGPAFQQSAPAAQAKAKRKLWEEIQKGAKNASVKSR